MAEEKEAPRQLTTYFEATAELWRQDDGHERLRYLGVAGMVAVAAVVVALILWLA
jgi:hypothetical protein